MSGNSRRTAGANQPCLTGSAPRGFTVVELMVAIGVIGLLAAITLPAIQASREASRRTTCSSHLHQMGVASQNHVATHGHYPWKTKRKGGGGIHGPLYALLPFVEAQEPTNEHKVQVAIYQCPSEPYPDRGSAWSTSYLVNNGSRIYLRSDWIVERAGLFSGWERPLRPRDVTDGEAYTAMFSERMLTPAHQSIHITPEEAADIYRRNPLVCTWRLGTSFFYGEEDAFLAACSDPSRRSPFSSIRPADNPGILNSLDNPYYDHVLPPNAPGCMYIEPPRPFLGWTEREWTLPANSAHPGGVTLVHCDAATRFVSEGIDVRVWRAIGTRNGGEPHGAY